jgi:Fic family protein
MYIHELADWPTFRWNKETILEQLIPIRHQQGLLIGKMKSLGFNLQQEAILQTLTQDVVKSSEIEGELLDTSLVRSSIARRLGMDIAGLDKFDRNIEGVVEMILDATHNYNVPINKDRLFAWHSALFPTGRSGLSKITVGQWRKGPMQVVSGHFGKENIHFEAPTPEKVDHEMDVFLNWLNDTLTIDPIIKAGISHLWFVTIHPFDDGNGRIGRAIIDYMLAQSEQSSQRFYSLSAQIQQERKAYYTILEQTQKGDLEITVWLEWFINCLGRGIEKANSTLSAVLFKAQFWQAINKFQLNERQKKIINLLLDGFEGKLTSLKFAKIAKCSQDTAYRDILELLNFGILIKNAAGGRSTSYSLQNLSSLSLE